MNQNIYTILDIKANAFLQPFFFDNTALALRSLTELANDPQHMFCKHASDYTLFLIGEFNPHTAELVIQTKISIINFLELRTIPENISTLPPGA